MIINGPQLLGYRPIKNMLTTKVRDEHASHGLSEAGYDIRLKQEIEYNPAIYNVHGAMVRREVLVVDGLQSNTNFTIASAMEEFDMPQNLVGIVHDKSTWARRGLSVFNTVIECGWRGFLTLELVFHGPRYLYLPAGVGIAQVLFHQVSSSARYDGKYQDQPDMPVQSRAG